jgi:ABC-type ATPase involved in cell division
MNIDNKLNNYLRITGIINNVFRPKKTLKKTRIKLCNTLALPALLYDGENWTIKARDTRRITATEMKYMRRRVGYNWTDHKTNTETAKELNITPVLDKIQDYKRNWIQHVNRMPRNRLHRLIKTTSQKSEGRPLKRLLDA